MPSLPFLTQRQLGSKKTSASSDRALVHSVEFEAEAGTSMLATIRSSTHFMEPRPAESKMGRTSVMLCGGLDDTGTTATAVASNFGEEIVVA